MHQITIDSKHTITNQEGVFAACKHRYLIFQKYVVIFRHSHLLDSFLIILSIDISQQWKFNDATLGLMSMAFSY